VRLTFNVVLFRPPEHYPPLISKTSGQFHSVKGTVVESIGNLTGSPSWQSSGKQEHAAGETEHKAAQAKGYAEGTMDRLTGKKDAVVGAVTGDRQQELAGSFESLIQLCLVLLNATVLLF